MSVKEVIGVVLLIVIVLPLLWDMVVLGGALIISGKSDPIFKRWGEELKGLNADDPGFWDRLKELRAKDYPSQTHAVLEEANRFIKTNGAWTRFLF